MNQKKSIQLDNVDHLDQVLQPRQQYNQWVANETLEDFALRHTARRSRRWSFSRIAGTALGTSSFLVLELLGATIAIKCGVYHSLWAIFAVCTLLFFSGLPISYYATKYSVDIDLLTRGAGFGYIGSTISSLIYASFTFIFFALEASIMATALELLLGIPIWLGYIVSALAVIPLVTHGISMISRFQILTQPIWLLLQIAPIIYIAQHPEGTLQQWLHFSGDQPQTTNTFSWLIFCTATTLLLALVAQIGEQVDFLRFLPEPSKGQRRKWWAAVIIAGPGWVVFGALKLVLGTIFAFLLIQQGFSLTEASDPTHMYMAAFEHFVVSPKIALVLAAVFVIVCQLKINVANAYAGSLAWSNFFSRLTHHHPGRVVWLIFNVAIALMLMELGVYQAIEMVLHHYSAFVLAWFGSIVADLIINKPLGLSPAHIEFKRAKLYDINPVGVGSTILASAAGLMASTAMLGETATAFSGFIAFFLPFITVPLIAYLTKGKYYLTPEIAESNYLIRDTQHASDNSHPKEHYRCCVCQNHFDYEDMSGCPAYSGQICSLCCALETRCKDQCRPNAHFGAQLENLVRPRVSSQIYNLLVGPVGQFSFIFTVLAVIALSIFYLSYFPNESANYLTKSLILTTLTKSFFLLLVLLGVIVWLFVLAQKSTRMALQETNLQTQKLTHEATAHKLTLQQLERARNTADSANVAKSDYVTALSHELRTPLNVILGYAQILQKDSELPTEQRDKLSILHRNGEHLATMIEGLLEISKIEAGKLSLNSDLVRLDLMLEQLVKMFKHQAQSKGLSFDYYCPANLPKTIKVDEKRLRQILINLLSNAIKFTEKGSVIFSVKYRGHVARFSVSDTGYGIAEEKIRNLFKPFERIDDVEQKHISGSGLGLAISRQLADMMGAEIEVNSKVGIGSTFTLLLQVTPSKTELPELNVTNPITGYQGNIRTILVVDDNEDHRQLLINLLVPLGFDVLEAHDFESYLGRVEHKLDLVLLDVRLGSASGWDIATHLRSQFDKLPIVMVSANARGLYQDMPNQRIHDDYLEKPLQLDALIEKIGSLLELKWVYSHIKKDNPTIDRNLPNLLDPHLTPVLDEPIQSPNPSPSLQQLIDYAKIGNLNEFLQTLNHTEIAQLFSKSLIEQLTLLANQYNFERILHLLTNPKNHPTDIL